jgi:hypothetical protein
VAARRTLRDVGQFHVGSPDFPFGRGPRRLRIVRDADAIARAELTAAGRAGIRSGAMLTQCCGFGRQGGPAAGGYLRMVRVFLGAAEVSR